MGCDPAGQNGPRRTGYFNPRSPNGLRRLCPCMDRRKLANFNPRSPNGLRPRAFSTRSTTNGFQSTQPEWAATPRRGGTPVYIQISIHAARMGCDDCGTDNTALIIISIHAARMGCDTAGKIRFYTQGISIHAARMGCDQRASKYIAR